jgi:hypothetical protein
MTFPELAWSTFAIRYRAKLLHNAEIGPMSMTDWYRVSGYFLAAQSGEENLNVRQNF